MQKGCVAAGAVGLLCDDLLATGGTLRAAKLLLERLGARVVGGVVLAEITDLGGAAHVGVPIVATLTY